MPEKCRILLFIGCRSDEGLSTPVLNRLENDDFFASHVQTLYASDFKKTFGLIDDILEDDIDLVICVADRLEMYAAAVASYINNIPIAHMYAGVVVPKHPTKDDVFRHSISLMSDIQFVESKKAMLNLEMLFMSVKKKSNCHIVGITHLDDLEVDESLVPKGWYNLILYNPITNKEKKEIIEREIEDIKAWAGIGINKNVVIGSNPDPWFWREGETPPEESPIYLRIKKEYNSKTTFYKNLPRTQFLGLLKNCQKFITNSSSALYEAPDFLEEEQIINIGIRQEDRTPIDITMTGASDKIIKIIKEWWLEKNG